MSFQGISGIAVDSRDRVYVFQRQGPAVVVLDQSGSVREVWQRRDGVPADAHHIHVGPDDTVYLTDRDAHQVLMYDTAGNPLGSLGTRDQPAMQAPFNHPADICVAPSGELYVADGYGNSSVHRFSPAENTSAASAVPAPVPGSSGCRTASAYPGTAGSTLPTGRTTGAGVHGGGRFPERVDGLQVPHGRPHRRGPSGLRDRPDSTNQHVHPGWRTVIPGRTFEGAHQVYTDSQGSIYGVDTANQRVQKFVKI